MEKFEMKRKLNYTKGLICNEFEKICPTEIALKRIIKDMHNIFDSLEDSLTEVNSTEKETDE